MIEMAFPLCIQSNNKLLRSTILFSTRRSRKSLLQLQVISFKDRYLSNRSIQVISFKDRSLSNRSKRAVQTWRLFELSIKHNQTSFIETSSMPVLRTEILDHQLISLSLHISSFLSCPARSPYPSCSDCSQGPSLIILICIR